MPGLCTAASRGIGRALAWPVRMALGRRSAAHLNDLNPPALLAAWRQAHGAWHCAGAIAAYEAPWCNAAPHVHAAHSLGCHVTLGLLTVRHFKATRVHTPTAPPYTTPYQPRPMDRVANSAPSGILCQTSPQERQHGGNRPVTGLLCLSAWVTQAPAPRSSSLAAKTLTTATGLLCLQCLGHTGQSSCPR